MMFLLQCIDASGAVVNDDVSGFPMTRDGAETLRRFLSGRIHPGFTYIVVPVTGGSNEQS